MYNGHTPVTKSGNLCWPWTSTFLFNDSRWFRFDNYNIEAASYYCRSGIKSYAGTGKFTRFKRILTISLLDLEDGLYCTPQWGALDLKLRAPPV
jgi:hypothetical protein